MFEQRVLLIALCAAMSACTSSFDRPRNLQSLDDAGYMAERQRLSSHPETDAFDRASYQNAGRCTEADLILSAPTGMFGSDSLAITEMPLSPGDMLRLSISSGEGFNGSFVVEADGKLHLPHLPPLPAAGLLIADVEDIAARHLIEGGFFKPNYLQIELDLLYHASIQVHVSGATFQPGDVVLNERKPQDESDQLVSAPGDHARGRALSRALFASGGVRPDADIQNILVMRQGQRRIFDMSGAFTGAPFHDPLLVAGDRVHVPSKGCFQMALARPSRISLPGIRIYISNLTQPSTSNASSGINKDATGLPYGTRLLQGLVAGNCVGGVQATNARRHAVLISRNPVTGQSEVVSRPVEALVRRADRDDFNPVLLPGDAIACYDSHFTNMRDVITAVTGAALPITNALLIGGTGR